MFELIDIRFKHILDIPYLKIDKPITCIVGASGSGKTTLLRLLNRLNIQEQGQIFYNQKDLEYIEPVALRREVVMLNQSPILYDGTIKDNLLIGRVFSEKQDVSDDMLKQVLTQVGLNKQLNEYCDKLSGGEKQRLCLARILLMDAAVYLLDEPSSALDANTELFIIQCLSEYVKEKGKQLIIVTHSHQISSMFQDAAIYLEQGKVVSKDE